MKSWLFLLSISGLVPVAVSSLPNVPYVYQLITTPVSWPVAQNYCRSMYTDLAKVQGDDDWKRLNSLLVSRSMTQPFWIGLYNDINSWRWCFNEVPLHDCTFINWYAGQPDNNGGRESCGIIDSNGYWWDTNCFDLRPFICYDGRNSGTDMFVVVTSAMLTWSDAQAYCREFHTDLVTVTTSADNDWLAQVASQSNVSYWIGLYRDTWKWLDGTKASNLPWTPGQPNNRWKTETCGLHYKPLEDFVCTYQYGFLCHTIPSQKQIVRLQVKSDGSAFDPDVQSSILKAIKQKLEEKGMLNTTVTWRVQPDGNIFHKKKNVV